MGIENKNCNVLSKYETTLSKYICFATTRSAFTKKSSKMSVIFEKRFYCYPLSHLGTDINRLFKFPLIPVLIVSSSLAIAAFIYISLVVWGRFQRKRTDSIDSTSSVISFCVYNNFICKEEILQYIQYFSHVSVLFSLSNNFVRK